MTDVFDIAGRINSTSNERVVTTADQIKDENKNKKQSQINAETDATLAEHGVGIRSLNSQNYVTVDTYGDLPETGSRDAVYRVCNWDGAYNSGEGQVDSTKYTLYAWTGSDYLLLSVESGIEEVFDVSQYNATGGSYATYESLKDLLDNHVADIPVARRKGGMSVKFIQGTAQSTDNKYVQYRLMSDTFNTNVANWQGVDDIPTPGSDNLVTSGGAYIASKSIVDSQNAQNTADLNLCDEEGNVIVMLESGHAKTKNFDSSQDATIERRGLMSAADKTKLENDNTKLSGIEEGAQVNNEEVVNTDNADLEFSDEQGNVLMKLQDGGIKTKNFDSKSVSANINIEYPIFIGKDLGNNNTLVDSDNRLVSMMVRAKKGDVVTIKDPVCFNVVKTTGLVEEPQGTKLQSALSLTTKRYFTSELASIETPSNIGDTITYYIEVTGESTTYTSWTITKTQTIDGIKVYEYKYDGAIASIAHSDSFSLSDYVVSDSSTSFIRIVGKPSASDPLYIDGVIYGNSAFVNNVCVIHNTKLNYRDNKVLINSAIPCGWYVSNVSEFSTTPQSEDPYESTGTVLTLKQVYDKLNELSTIYSDYFHLSVLGYDSSDGKPVLHQSYADDFADWLDENDKLHIPIYKFELYPSDVVCGNSVSRKYNNNDLPVIYLQFGTHADEKPILRAMMNFLIHLCRDWRDNEFLSYIRWNCKIVGIPIVCPYSYADHTSGEPLRAGRKNYNGVNVNRNYYGDGLWYMFDDSTQQDMNNKGDSYLSEIETKICCRNLLENANAIVGLDFHTYGQFTRWSNIMAYSVNANNGISDILQCVGFEVIKGITLSGWKNHKLPQDSGYINHLEKGNVPSFNCLYLDIGVSAGTPEGLYKYYDGTSGTVYNTYTDCMNEEYVANLVISALRQYNNTNI